MNIMTHCPSCNAKLDQETYYDGMDTTYYNFCPECGWDDYDEYTYEPDTTEIYCPDCDVPLVGFVHSNGKSEGDLCLKCGQVFNVKPCSIDTNGDYEELILARQELDFD